MKAASCCRTPNLNRHKAVFPSVFFISEGLVAKAVVGYAVFMHYLPVPFSSRVDLVFGLGSRTTRKFFKLKSVRSGCRDISNRNGLCNLLFKTLLIEIFPYKNNLAVFDPKNADR